MVDDVVAAFEDGVGERVGAQVLPGVFDRVELGKSGREGEWRDVLRDDQVLAAVPSGIVEGQNSLAPGAMAEAILA